MSIESAECVSATSAVHCVLERLRFWAGGCVTRQLYTKVYFELQQLCERQDRTLDTKPVALEEFERIEGRSAAKADQHRERAKSIMVKSRASEPSPQSPPLDDDAELSDADSF